MSKGSRNRSCTNQFRQAYDEIDWHHKKTVTTVPPKPFDGSHKSWKQIVAYADSIQAIKSPKR